MFNATVFVSEQLNRLMVNAAQELAQRAVSECADKYNFDAMEAIRFLGLENIKVERKSTGKSVEKLAPKAKVLVVKPAFPLPFNGEFNDAYCYALRQNNGLYTQCQIARKGDKHFCKSCQALADKNEGTPEYGVIQSRLAAGIFEYVDPKGRKPIAYTKVMKKYKLSSEQVLEEAGKFNIIIDSNHFIVPEEDVKRGRPSSKKEKAPKEPKGAKGRPKKTKKVLQIEGDEEDLFAALVADANEEDEEMVLAPKKKGKSEEEKEAERIAKEAEKAEKEAKRIAEKEEREAKLAAEKAEKEAKKEAERLARELKKAEEEAAKKAKEEQRLKDKAEKEAKLLEAKSKKSTKKAAEPEDDEEPDKVKKIEFEGKKYLKSRNTGIIYDYLEFVKNQEQVVVGQWNEAKNKIDFSSPTDEESEDEYD
jgi:hypothetical protein